MTAAIVGIFLFRHYDASWGWYAALIGMAFLEGFHQDNFRAKVFERLSSIRIALGNLARNEPDEDD